MKVFLIVVIVMAVLLLGALGYVVVDKRINGGGSEAGGNDAPVESSRNEEAKVKTADKYSLKNAASEINTVLASRLCGNGLIEITAEDFTVADEKETFEYEDGKSRIDPSLSFAYVQYGCGSQGGVALMKRNKGQWALVSSDLRMYPLCGSVRDRGFPASVIDKCYENTGAKQPVTL